ncbi:hypothetical protein KCU62_g488, partial [Aureobasidium sp. EXF-3399]
MHQTTCEILARCQSEALLIRKVCWVSPGCEGEMSRYVLPEIARAERYIPLFREPAAQCENLSSIWPICNLCIGQRLAYSAVNISVRCDRSYSATTAKSVRSEGCQVGPDVCMPIPEHVFLKATSCWWRPVDMALRSSTSGEPMTCTESPDQTSTGDIGDVPSECARFNDCVSFMGIVTLTTLPCPLLLRTSTLPLQPFTIRATILIPRPVPSVKSSSWLNARNSFVRKKSLDIPLPVSVTESWAVGRPVLLCGGRILNDTLMEPSDVYLRALLTRLTQTRFQAPTCADPWNNRTNRRLIRRPPRRSLRQPRIRASVLGEHQRSSAGVNLCDHLCSFVVNALILQYFNSSENPVQGRSQLVADGRNECISPSVENMRIGVHDQMTQPARH